MKIKKALKLRYQAFLIVGFAMFVFAIALSVPSVQLSLFGDREIISVGSVGFSTGDMFLIIATLGACVDIGTLFFMFVNRRQK